MVTTGVRLVALAWLAIAVVVLSGCRVDVASNLVVRADGSGQLAVSIAMDQELVTSLTATGLDLAPEEVSGWQVTTSDLDGDGRLIQMSSLFADPDDLTRAVADLSAGLDDQDPHLLDGVVLTVADDGSAELTAKVGVRLPTSTGAEAPGFFDGDDLAALVAQPDVFDATLTVTMPGRISDSNADRVDGTTATWDLPVGATIQATATSAPPSIWQGPLPAILGAVVVLATLTALVWVWRRRRRDRAQAPLGRVERLRRFDEPV